MQSKAPATLSSAAIILATREEIQCAIERLTAMRDGKAQELAEWESRAPDQIITAALTRGDPDAVALEAASFIGCLRCEVEIADRALARAREVVVDGRG